MTQRDSGRMLQLLLVCCLACTTALAQTYPARPIRLIVPSSAGSGSDFVARIVALGITQTLGQQFVIDNRAGGGGNIAAELGARAPADGYTLVQISITHAINASLYPKLSYNLMRDFLPLTLLGTQANLVVVNASAPLKSIDELVKLAKASPGKLNFSSSGIGSNSFLATELLNSMVDIRMVHVPYKGGGPAVAAVAAGEVTLMIGPISTSMPFLQQWKLRGIAVSSARRLAEFLDYPTIGETIPGFEFETWFGLALPEKTPGEYVSTLHRAAVAALKQPDIVKQLSHAGFLATPMEPAAFAAFLKSEISKLAAMIRQTGARAD